MEKQKYISKDIAEKVLTLGVEWRNPRGGVASVEYAYAQGFDSFNHISTCLPSGNKVSKFFQFFKALVCVVFKFVSDKKIKIVHLHGASYASFWRKMCFIYVSKIFGKKVVYHIHSGEFKVFSEKHERIVRAVLDQCDVVIALSSMWKDYFETHYGCKNVEALNNIIEKPEIKEVDKNKEEVTLLFLGVLTQKKGVYTLLDVMSKYHEKFAGKVRLLIGGEGESDKVRQFIINNKLEDCVEMLGFVSGDEKIAVLNRADVYILPSFYEGVPISILECMSYGMPIISSNVGGIPSIVEDGVNGILVTPGSLDEIGGAIDLLLSDKEKREKMGESSKSKAFDYYPVAVFEKLEQIYKSCL